MSTWISLALTSVVSSASFAMASTWVTVAAARLGRAAAAGEHQGEGCGRQRKSVLHSHVGTAF